MNVSCVGHLSSANTVTNIPTVAINPPVGARLQQFWESLGSSPKVVTILREGYTLPFRFRPNLTRSPTVISNYVNPQRQTHLLEALYQLTNKNAVEPVANQNSAFLQLAILGTQTQQPVETYPGPEHLEHLPKHRVIQNGDPRDNKDLPTGRGVGQVHRLQGHILPSTNSVQEVHAFSHPGSVLPVQSWSVHSTHGVHSGGQRGQTDGLTEGYKNPPVPRRLVGESHIPPNLSPAYTDLGSSLLVNEEKSELEPKQVFNFIGCQFDLMEGKVRPTPERWQTFTDKIQSILSGPVCPVRQFMSLMGLLTATEKQVHPGRLHMRPPYGGT